MGTSEIGKDGLLAGVRHCIGSASVDKTRKDQMIVATFGQIKPLQPA
ncbi:hypothetical protein [Metapseudomonas otitidis]|nr:hypothetical protein [Pseudomonas otitidis]